MLLLRYHLKPNYCIFTWLAHATFFKYVKKYPKKLNSNIPVIYLIAEKLKPWSLKSFLQIPNAFQQCLSHNSMPTLCDILLTFKVCKWSGKLIKSNNPHLQHVTRPAPKSIINAKHLFLSISSSYGCVFDLCAVYYESINNLVINPATKFHWCQRHILGQLEACED